MGLLAHTSHVLQHMSLLIKCCPSDVSLQEWTPLPKTMLSPLSLSSSDDPLVTDVSKTLEVRLVFSYGYRKIPKISPGASIFQRPFLRGLFLERPIFGRAYLRREICVSKSIGLAL